jgi:hypothetical protein
VSLTRASAFDREEQFRPGTQVRRPAYALQEPVYGARGMLALTQLAALARVLVEANLIHGRPGIAHALASGAASAP